MKVGFVSAILENATFEQTLDVANSLEFQCIEAACWPCGKAERRYAGVSHIDVDRVNSDKDYAAHIVDYTAQKDVALSSLAFYPNILDADKEKRESSISHLKQVIRASAKLGVNLVTTFIGRDQYKTVEENLKLVSIYWPSIVALAEDMGVRIAIENCPMLFGADQWPGGQNIMTSPAIWKKVFEILPSMNIGINYDPSHFVWQMIDYIKPIYDFREKIFHVHFKDIKLYNDKLNQVGVMSYPLDFMAPKLPGLGDVDWGKFVSALSDIAYNGFACIEVEDRSFEGSNEAILTALKLSKGYLAQYIY